MDKTDQVYCLYCRQMMVRKDMVFIFKTGYYRKGIPVSVCRTCSLANATREELHDPAAGNKAGRAVT